MAAARLHGDDTTAPVLAKGKTDTDTDTDTDTGRIWVNVRDDRPFAGEAAYAAVFYYSRDRSGEHPKQRREHVAPLVVEWETWMRAERARLSRRNDVAKACDYMLTRWDGVTRFLHDGRICMTNNAAERALCGIALGRKSWLIAGSDLGGHTAAVMYSLIVTAKMNDVDPQAWLADVLATIADTP